MSLGFNSTLQDCDGFLRFLEETFLNKAPVPLFPSCDAVLAPMDPRFPALDADGLFLTKHVQFMGSGRVTETDQGDELVLEGTDSSVPRPIKLAAIFVYPIKSCAGEQT